MNELAPLLMRQLKRLGITDLTRSPEPELFKQLLERVSDQYTHASEDRALLTRSLDLSTEEMNVLRMRVESERDRLQAIIGAIAEAVSVMSAASGDAGPSLLTGAEATGMITTAKQVFANKLKAIFSDGGSHSAEESSRVRVIETGFFRLADQIESMLREMASSASMRAELEVARAVQQMLLPPQDVIERNGITLAAYFQPADECGGDWWNVQEVADGKLLAVIGDVTGHGIASAILTGTAKATADLAHLVTRGKVTGNLLLHLMNHAIYQAGRQKVMMTAGVGMVDLAAHTLTVGNAGHAFPLMIHDGAVRPVIAHGQPLGSAENNEYQLTTVPLASGDMVVWYTDGVTERENEAGEQFSEKRLRALCQRSAQLSARDFRDELVRSVLTFASGKAATDDMTLMVARVD